MCEHLIKDLNTRKPHKNSKKLQINQWHKNEIYHAKRQVMREKVKICRLAVVWKFFKCVAQIKEIRKIENAHTYTTMHVLMCTSIIAYPVELSFARFVADI